MIDILITITLWEVAKLIWRDARTWRREHG